jgi:hypothetical protein
MIQQTMPFKVKTNNHISLLIGITLYGNLTVMIRYRILFAIILVSINIY